jgi:hypothetical protein
MRMSARSAVLLALVSCSVPLVAASAEEAASAARFALANGAEVVVLPGEGPLELAFEMAVGTLDDPPGREGLAELVARCLPLGTEARPDPADLAEALRGAASEIDLGVGPSSTVMSLTGVTDLRTALGLAVQILSTPRLPHATVGASRLALAGDLVGAARGGGARRLEAEHLLHRRPDGWSRPWSVLALEREDVEPFHRTHYRADRLRVAITGAGLPPPAELAARVDETVGAWAARTGPPPAPAGTPRTEGTARASLLVGAADEGVTVAFPVPASGGGAVLLALWAAAEGDSRHDWVVHGDAHAPAGDLCLAPGRLLFADATCADPASASRELLRRLAAVSRRGVGKEAWPRLADAARFAGPPALSLLSVTQPGGAVAPGADQVASLLGTLTPEGVSAAAAALVAGPHAVVAVVLDARAAAAWKSAWPGTAERAIAEPADLAARARSAEAAAWMRKAVEAHGGAAFLGLHGLTSVADEIIWREGAAKPMGVLRIDSDVEGLRFRQEHRSGGKLVPYRVTLVQGMNVQRFSAVAMETVDPVESLSIRNELFRHPVALLQRAATRGFPVRSEGEDVVAGKRVVEVSVADPDIGLSRIAFDAESGLLARVRYRSRIRATFDPREITVTYSDHRRLGDVVLPFHQEATAGFASSWGGDVRHWVIRTPPWDPSQVRTSPDDVGVDLSPAPPPTADGTH